MDPFDRWLDMCRADEAAAAAQPKVPAPCTCGHLTDAQMGDPHDAKIARETPGPHHTPIRCEMYAPRSKP